MRTDEQCKLLCPPVKLDAAKTKAFRTRVEEDYRVNMYALLPRAMRLSRSLCVCVCVVFECDLVLAHDCALSSGGPHHGITRLASLE